MCIFWWKTVFIFMYYTLCNQFVVYICLSCKKRERNKKSLKPSLNQISGIQYFHFSLKLHIYIIPSSHTTQSHYLYSTCPGKNIGDWSKYAALRVWRPQHMSNYFKMPLRRTAARKWKWIGNGPIADTWHLHCRGQVLLAASPRLPHTFCLPVVEQLVG